MPGSDGDFQGKRLQELQTSLQKRLSTDGASQPKDIYQLLVEQSQQGLLIVQDFEIVYANPILPEITGYSLEEMKAFTFGIITAALRPKDLPGAWVRLVSYIANGVLSPRLEFCFPHGDGTARWAETYAEVVTTQTVKNYVRRIFRKLGVETRVDAVLYAIDQGIDTKSPKQSDL